MLVLVFDYEKKCEASRKVGMWPGSKDVARKSHFFGPELMCNSG